MTTDIENASGGLAKTIATGVRVGFIWTATSLHLCEDLA
jgi:hypothetical protein